MGKRDSKNVNAINVRPWYVEGGVRVDRAPVPLIDGKFGDPSQALGDSTPVKSPNPYDFNTDVEIGTVEGAVERATLSVSQRYKFVRDILSNLARKKCRVDWYALVGNCGDPMDFTRGGEKTVIFIDGKFSNRSIENFGAFGTDENNPANSMVDVNSEDYWEILYEAVSETATTLTAREVLTVDNYIPSNCEDCGDGCDVILATMAGTGATPGTKPILIWSDDGGENWYTQNISTMFSTEDITGAAIIGGDLVVVTGDGAEIHYTTIADVVLSKVSQENTWMQNDGGFVAAGAPQAITTVNASHTWLVGLAGYIYFLKNHELSAVVQGAGVTTEDLRDVHAFDSNNVLAVGDNNAVLYTRNGGATWQTITGPAVGIDLSACWMWDEDVWFIGEGAGGNGRLWYTVDGGYNWAERELPGNPNRIDFILFVDEAEGFVLGRDGGQSYVYRTKTGGNEFIALPDSKVGSMPDNSYLNEIAACPSGVNTGFTVGLDDAGTGGVIFKISAVGEE